MDNTRRSGIDRRTKHEEIAQKEQRQNKERRSLMNIQDEVIERFRKVPMFNGLDTDQLREILNICLKKKFPTHEQIFIMGEKSDNMFVLLRGKIDITYGSGIKLQSITPAGCIGEMGFFTGENRSATVVAVTECIALFINKAELFRLFDLDKDLAIKVLLNTIRDISQKMRKDNEQIEDLLYRIRSMDIV